MNKKLKKIEMLEVKASDPKTNKSVLKKMANSVNEFIRKQVASNPNTPMKVLKKMFFYDESELVRAAVLNNNTFKY